MIRSKVGLVLVAIGTAVLALLLLQLRRGGVEEMEETEKTGRELFLYSGGGLRLAVDECVEIFQEESGAEVKRNYAGSGVILSQVLVTKRGDLFMPGDVSYIDKIEPAELVESRHTVCYFIPAILVKKGNPMNIETLEDLIKPGIRLGLGDSQVCAIGRKSVQIFEKNNIDIEAVKENLVFNSLTVGELGVQIQVGKVDATIVWDATAAQYADAGDMIRIPAEQNVISTVAIALLESSEDKELAREFIDLITSERGQAVFRKHNFSTELTE